MTITQKETVYFTASSANDYFKVCVASKIEQLVNTKH